MTEARQNVRVLDATFDSAYNHRLLREYIGILSTIPPLHGRPAEDPTLLALTHIAWYYDGRAI